MNQLKFEDLTNAISCLADEISEIKKILTLNQSTTIENSKDQILTVKETSDFLSLKPSTIYALIQKGELPYMKRTKRVYFQVSELVNYLKNGKCKSTQGLEQEVKKYLKNIKGRTHG